MFAYNYPNGVDKIELISGSNYAYSMKNDVAEWRFRQIFTVVLFASINFAAAIFRVGEKPLLPDQQPNYRN